MYDTVKKQHEKFGLLYSGAPRHLSQEEKMFYIEAIKEETMEYFQAQTLTDEYDAVLDILVFTIGLMLRHGFDPKGIQEVVRANMTKELGPNLGKRNDFQLDLFKPEGWKAPELGRFL